ncbi:MAG TPA: MMPL family transporter [Thermoanaerobaculia bacterium]|jgi:predicted RND superfamily exporter protein|nr:MMPL family transporter [Thermoanaerobaculia bacterium]
MLWISRAALRWPVPTLLLFLLGSAVAAAGLFRLEIRTDGAAIYPQGDATVERTLRDRQTFLEPEQIILLVSSRPGGPAIASPAGFRFLRRTYFEMRKLPGVSAFGVHSLADMVEPPPPGKLQIITPLDEIPDDPAAFAALLARIRRIPVAAGLFLSRDGRAAPFYIPLARGADRRELIRALESWRAARAAAPFELRITGPAAAEAVLGEAVLRDLTRLVPVMVAALALLLAVALRTPVGVIAPLAQVLATLLWTLGLMGWAGVPVTLVTTILPVLLMAMSMTDEIHLHERIQHRLAGIPREVPARERLLAATGGSFADIASPLILTSLTTAAGSYSFLGAAMAPLRDLGLFAGTGLLLAMLFTFSLVPALIAVLPPRWAERRSPGRPRRDLDLERRFSARARAFALTGATLLVLAIPGLFRLRVQDSWIDNFDPRSPLVAAERIFNRSFWGSYRFDVVFTGPEREFFWTARGVALLEDFDRLARSAPHVGGWLGPLQYLEVGARAQGNELPISRLPPLSVKGTGQIIEILAIRISLRQYLTADQSAARVRLFVPSADYARGRELRAWLERRLPALAARRGAQVHVSGDVPVGLAVVGSIVGNQLSSIGWTAATIALMLLAAFRSPRWTAVLMAPVLAATLLLFGALGYAGVPLGIATSMFAALTLGAGVDFALHYVHAYRRERRAGRPHDEAVLATLRTAGRGVFWNAVVLACGFSVLAVSAIKPNASLGLLLAAAMLVSCATTVGLLPEILRRWGGGS